MGYIVRAVLESTLVPLFASHCRDATQCLGTFARICVLVLRCTNNQLKHKLLQQATTSHAEPRPCVSADSQPTKGVGRGMTCRRGPRYSDARLLKMRCMAADRPTMLSACLWPCSASRSAVWTVWRSVHIAKTPLASHRGAESSQQTSLGNC